MALMTQTASANEGDAKVQFNLGVMNLNSGKGDEAIAAFQKAAAADPANAEPYFYIGTVLVGQNKVPDAITSLEKYLAMKPTNAQNVATAQGLLQALKPKK
jgi:tetratricopeptide (TPR) repeat protein